MINFINNLFGKKEFDLENSDYRKSVFGGKGISKIKTTIEYTETHDYNHIRLSKMSSRFE